MCVSVRLILYNFCSFYFLWRITKMLLPGQKGFARLVLFTKKLAEKRWIISKLFSNRHPITQTQCGIRYKAVRSELNSRTAINILHIINILYISWIIISWFIYWSILTLYELQPVDQMLFLIISTAENSRTNFHCVIELLSESLLKILKTRSLIRSYYDMRIARLNDSPRPKFSRFACPGNHFKKKK